VRPLIPFVEAFAEATGSEARMTAIHVPDASALDLDPWPTALLHIARAAMAQNRGSLAELGAESEKALSTFTQIGDLWGIALSEQMRATWLAINGRLQDALELTDLSTAHMRDITPHYDLAQQQGLAIQMLSRLGRTSEALARMDAVIAEAEATGSGRAILAASLTAASLYLQLGRLDEATGILLTIESARASWPREPGQITGMVEAVRGGIATARGDLDLAETHLRAAAAAAVRSQDQPVIGAIAINVGTYALARGQVELAVQAVDFATSMLGAYDFTNPEVIAIDEAAREKKIGRPSTEVPERPISIASLEDLLAR